jgi:hypothetical protein
MCLQFAFLLITRVTTWLRLSQREEAWQTAEILILRHQLAVLQRRQPRRPHLNWADRALLAALLSVIPKAPEPVDLEQYRVRRQARAGGLINEYRLVARRG